VGGWLPSLQNSGGLDGALKGLPLGSSKLIDFWIAYYADSERDSVFNRGGKHRTLEILEERMAEKRALRQAEKAHCGKGQYLPVEKEVLRVGGSGHGAKQLKHWKASFWKEESAVQVLNSGGKNFIKVVGGRSASLPQERKISS